MIFTGDNNQKSVALNGRHFVIYDDELSDSRLGEIAFWRLFSVMLFPEDQDAQQQWRDGLCDHVLQDALREASNEERYQLSRTILESPLLGVRFSYRDQTGEWDATLNKAVLSRKKGLTGGLAVRGSLAGLILIRTLQLGSLEEAYLSITNSISNFKTSPPPDLKNATLLTPDELRTPSKSLLKVLWAKYKNVAHFWAAKHWRQDNPDESLGSFLCVASWYRYAMIGHGDYEMDYIIKKPQQVWEACNEDGKRFKKQRPS